MEPRKTQYTHMDNMATEVSITSVHGELKANKAFLKVPQSLELKMYYYISCFTLKSILNSEYNSYFTKFVHHAQMALSASLYTCTGKLILKISVFCKL